MGHLFGLFPAAQLASRCLLTGALLVGDTSLPLSSPLRWTRAGPGWELWYRCAPAPTRAVISQRRGEHGLAWPRPSGSSMASFKFTAPPVEGGPEGDRE